MPAIPQTIANELLPLIFRRQRRPQPIIGNDLPEQGGYSGNMLAPAPQDPAAPLVVAPGAKPSNYALPEETRPRQVTQPGITSPGIVSESAPQPSAPALSKPVMPVDAPMSRSGQLMDENAIRSDRRVETNRQGRPTPNIALQGDEQTLDYQDRLARMPEDREGGGWWPKIRAAIAGFAAGGPVGAAAGFGTRALREHFDPTLGSREYKAEQMRQNAPAVEQIRQARKDRLDEESKVASTGLAKARTEAIKNPKLSAKWVIKQDENGVFRPVNQATGLDPDGKPVKGKLTSPSEWELKIDDNGRFVPVNKRTGLDQNGKPVKARPLSGKETEDVTFGNAQIQRAISEAEAEQKKIDEGLVNIPRTIQSTDILGNPRTIANPDYTYNMTRRRQLDDDIRNWRQKLKSPKKSAATKTSDPLGLFDDENEP